MHKPAEFLIRAGHVVCPASGLDGPGAVAVSGDRILAAGSEVNVAADTVLHFPGAALLPGLIDLHAHPAREGSVFGVDPDQEMLPDGVTTVLSQGDAGAATWQRYQQTTIVPSKTRILVALNVGTYGESQPGGSCADLADVDVCACAATIEADAGTHIWGIAVNLSSHSCGRNDPREVLHRALAIAGQTNRPLLVGLRQPQDWPLEEQLALLRPGDVVTYCFRREPHCIVSNGQVLPAVREAQARGIRFDVGHGRASFDFATAATALADGFAPDTISTDFQVGHVGSRPRHSLLRTMAKLLAAGMPEREVLAAVTQRPAQILGLQAEIGSLRVGACADLTVVRWIDPAEPLTDVYGSGRPGGCWEPVMTMRAGQIVPLRA